MNYEQDGFMRKYIEGDSSFENPVAFVTISDTPDGLTAHAFVQAPSGRGDECMDLIRDRLGQVAGEFGRSITHIFEATHRGAVALAERSGYKYVMTNEKSYKIYTKVYSVPDLD